MIAKKLLRRSLRRKAASIGSSVEAAAAVLPGVGGDKPSGRRWGLIGAVGAAVLGAGALAWFLKGRDSDPE